MYVHNCCDFDKHILIGHILCIYFFQGGGGGVGINGTLNFRGLNQQEVINKDK
jgi:hypothetical protein